MRPTSSSIPRAITILFMLVMLFSYQNCGVQTGAESTTVNGVKVSCAPSDQPCLGYKISVANLSQLDNDKVSFQLSGSATEGTATTTTFSSNCQRINNTTAYCPFGQTASGRIESAGAASGATAGISRQLTISFLPEEGMQSISGSTIGKTKLDDGGDETFEQTVLCFDGTGSVFRDGDFIPFTAFIGCPTSRF